MQLVIPDCKGPRTLGIEPLLDDEEFFAFCQENPELRIERTAQGKIEIMPPAGIDCGDQEAEVDRQLRVWAKKDGRGRGFGSATGFILPNGAVRGASALWVSNDQIARLPEADRSRFAHVCPEFVIEARSALDSVKRLREKMREWMDNGAQLAWLVDSIRQSVAIYRPGRQIEELIHPGTVDGEGPVAGFRLDMRQVWLKI